MPRLRPAPNEENEIKGMEIELTPEGEVSIENEAGTPAGEQDNAAAAKAREYRQQKKQEEEARLAENAQLKQQLDDMRAAMEESRRQAQEAQRLREEAVREAQERQREAGHYLTRAEEVEYRSVLSAMGAAEAEADGARRELENALNIQDNKTVVEAQSRLSRAEAKILQLEGSKAELEERKTRAAQRQQEQPQRSAPQHMTVEQQIHANPALSPTQKEWLIAHQDAWTDPRKNMRLQGAHVEAEDAGLTAGTKKYFDYLEERLGYKAPDTDIADEEDEPPTPQPKRNARVSAPVSRSAAPTSASSSRTKITLTPAQLEAAQISGLTPEAYAKQLLKYQDMRSDGFYDN